jgi:hypothetical protein
MFNRRKKAAQRNVPHDHQGVITPFEGAPPAMELTADQRVQLDRGKSVMVQIQDRSGGGLGMSIQDVAAPPEAVWSRITSYADYPRWVGPVSECETYDAAGDHIKTRFLLKGLGFRIEYFIDHVVRPDQGFMTWTLDYTRRSDLDDSVGYWFVEAHPTRDGWTRLYYSVDVRMKGRVPKIVQDIVTRQGLKEATAWVKRESEAVAR